MEPNLDHQQQPQSQNADIQLNLTDEVANGSYANLVISNYSSEEFVLDFSFLQPQLRKATVTDRVIISPRNTKKMVALLKRQIDEYESKYGAIVDEGPGAVIPFSFN